MSCARRLRQLRWLDGRGSSERRRVQPQQSLCSRAGVTIAFLSARRWSKSQQQPHLQSATPDERVNSSAISSGFPSPSRRASCAPWALLRAPCASRHDPRCPASGRHPANSPPRRSPRRRLPNSFSQRWLTDPPVLPRSGGVLQQVGDDALQVTQRVAHGHHITIGSITKHVRIAGAPGGAKLRIQPDDAFRAL